MKYRVEQPEGSPCCTGAFVVNGTRMEGGRRVVKSTTDGRTYWVSALWIRARFLCYSRHRDVQPYESGMWRPTVDDLATSSALVKTMRCFDEHNGHTQ